MAVTINAVAGSGLAQTADGSGILKVQSNGVTTNALAWVNFNGTITSGENRRSSYNVSSVTRNSTGDYTINFTNALSDANYTTCITGENTTASNCYTWLKSGGIATASAIQIQVVGTGGLFDSARTGVVIFGN
jgi:hypothetical protein